MAGQLTEERHILIHVAIKKALEQTPEEAQTTAEIKDEVIPAIAKRLEDEYNELGLHSSDIETREKIKQNRNVAEAQIMSGQPINVPHSDVSEPIARPKLNKSILNSNGQLLATKAEQVGINPSDALTIAHLESGANFLHRHRMQNQPPTAFFRLLILLGNAWVVVIGRILTSRSVLDCCT
ncbi:hypothetical protein AQ484_11085 [Acinetobacter baumannii]|nr:hypothetical protein AQ484_11085 [Acinetobacter baumannii]